MLLVFTQRHLFLESIELLKLFIVGHEEVVSLVLGGGVVLGGRAGPEGPWRLIIYINLLCSELFILLSQFNLNL